LPDNAAFVRAEPELAAPELAELVVADTRRWLEQAVIGLNLCPFAKAVHVKGQIHFAVSHASSPAEWLRDLRRELLELVALEPQVRDTTLLMAPLCLPDFWDFNAFLAQADRVLADLALEGVVQIAPFHPQFEFAYAAPGDITHCTNRAPYPTLHLLREDSVARAVEAFPEAEMIFEKNMQTLTALGQSGWDALKLGARVPNGG
jgi:uncharacterized protein